MGSRPASDWNRYNVYYSVVGDVVSTHEYVQALLRHISCHLPELSLLVTGTSIMYTTVSEETWSRHMNMYRRCSDTSSVTSRSPASDWNQYNVYYRVVQVSQETWSRHMNMYRRCSDTSPVTSRSPASDWNQNNVYYRVVVSGVQSGVTGDVVSTHEYVQALLRHISCHLPELSLLCSAGLSALAIYSAILQSCGIRTTDCTATVGAVR
ncbi:hypothetical protein J6590_016590 [Homalodisca vitripennis]|nr:hypothetical protein J6590_016590 [Homalodisca vitripennis]